MANVRVRILAEQEVHSSQPDRGYLASGSEVDLPTEWAKELLGRGEAEPIAEKASERAEKRPAKARIEKR